MIMQCTVHVTLLTFTLFQNNIPRTTFGADARQSHSHRIRGNFSHKIITFQCFSSQSPCIFIAKKYYLIMTPLDPLPSKNVELIINEDKFFQQTCTSSTPRPSNNERNDHRISWTLYPLIFILQWLAACPLKIKRAGRIVRFEFSWLSVPFIISLLYMIGTFIVLGMWVVNAVYDKDIPFRWYKK